jgi:hypothetical protein
MVFALKENMKCAGIIFNNSIWHIMENSYFLKNIWQDAVKEEYLVKSNQVCARRGARIEIEISDCQPTIAKDVYCHKDLIWIYQILPLEVRSNNIYMYY